MGLKKKAYRAFLNDDTAMPGAVVVEFYNRNFSNGGAKLKISDCRRIIEIEFDVDNVAARKASIRKLAKLQTALDLIRKELTGE